MQKELLLFKIKEGKKQDWVQWNQNLNAREGEVKDLLEEENVDREFSALVEGKQDDYVIGYFESESGSISSAEFSGLNKEFQKKIDECLDLIGSAEMLHDISKL